MSKIRKRYTKAEKLSIVTESLEQGASLGIVASRYSIHPNTISKWRREQVLLGESAFPGNGNATLTDQEREMRVLKKQLEESRLSIEILKKALGIISSPSKRNLLS